VPEARGRVAVVSAGLRRAAAPGAAGWLAAAALLVLALVFLVLVGRPLATDDAWWHLALGELFWREGPWPAEDPLLHTADTPPVPHEWLFQILLHGVLETAGFPGLRGLHVGFAAAAVGLAFALFRREARGLAVAAGATAVFLELSWYRLFQLRPDVFTISATLGLYLLLLAPRPGGGPPSGRAVAGAAALLALWANVHSIFAAGLALVAAAAAGAFAEAGLARFWVGDAEGAARARRRAGRLALAFAAGLGVTLLNPRGVEQHLTFFTESATGQIWRIRDDFLPFDPLRPPRDNPALTPLAWALVWGLFAGTAAVAATAAWRLVRRRSREALAALDAEHLALAAAACVAMATAVRFHWLAAFPLLLLVRAERRRLPPRASAPATAWAAAAGTLALALAFPAVNQLRAHAREVLREEDGYASGFLEARYCEAGARFLEETGLEGRLFNSFNMGGFLGFRLAPQLRTFIDGRMDHFPAEVLDDYVAIRNASRYGPARRLNRLLEERRVDLYFGDHFPDDLYPGRSRVVWLRRIPDWMPVYASANCSLYLRRHPRNARNLARIGTNYERRGVPFHAVRGLDVSRALREAPGWAAAQGLRHPEREALAARARGADPNARYRALVELAAFAWRVGDFEAQIRWDREAAALRPEAPEPRRRLADALLQTGRPVEALAILERLRASHPGYEDVGYLHAVAQKLAKRRRSRKP